MSRKPPTERSILPDEYPKYLFDDDIKDFTDVNESLCPPGYKLDLEAGERATFYKMEKSKRTGAPEVTETIVVDKLLHVKLFKYSSPLPLPEFFRKRGNCLLKNKSVLENFPPYIRKYNAIKNIPEEILAELEEIRSKKPDGRPKFSANLLRYALLLYYTSSQAYQVLLQQFPFPSISLLKKLCKGGVEPLKVAKLLLEQDKIDKDVVLLLDEMYLQKDAQYQDGKVIGVDDDGIFYKGIFTFMIVSLKKSIPVVIKSVPETKLKGEWISEHIDECINALQKCGFQVRGVIADNADKCFGIQTSIQKVRYDGPTKHNFSSG